MHQAACLFVGEFTTRDAARRTKAVHFSILSETGDRRALFYKSWRTSHCLFLREDGHGVHSYSEQSLCCSDTLEVKSERPGGVQKKVSSFFFVSTRQR